jgi:dimethylargininase
MHPSHDKKHQHPEKHHHHRHGHADDSGVQRLFSIEELDKDAVVDGGDVLVVGDVVFVGRSTRTNGNGLRAIEKVAAPMGYKVVGVDVGTQFMHLKCAVSKLDEQTVFVNSQWLSPKIFSDAGLQVVELPSPDKEPDAANVLSFAHSVPAVGFNVVKTVAVSAAHQATHEFLVDWAKKKNAKVSYRGQFWDVVAVDVSEIAKAEGALTCCSLLCYS